MQDLLTELNLKRRPRQLLRTAKPAAADYIRDQHLRRIFGPGDLPRHAVALRQLMDLENKLDRARRSDAPSYCLVTHVDLMIAMLGEARLLRASTQRH